MFWPEQNWAPLLLGLACAAIPSGWCLLKLRKTQALLAAARHQEQLQVNDPLTGLPNRLLLKTSLAHALETVRRRSRIGAVLFIDLDRFKHRLRESDTLARIGGDEFVALIEEIAVPGDAALVAASLIEQASLPFALSGDHSAQVSCSIGIALVPEDSMDADELLHSADIALSQAKEQGRGRYCGCTGVLP